MDNKNLENNSVDLITSIIAGASGLIPIVGGPISELIHCVIPNQRQDRIVSFINHLDKKINEIGITVDLLNLKFQDNRYGTFLYNCCRETINEIYEEKVKYYEDIFIKGIQGDKEELLRLNYILSILSKINYPEILYLKFYYYADYADRDKLNEIKNELGIQFLKPSYMMSMSQNQINNETYKQIIINNLFQNNLLENEYKNGKEKTKINKVGKLLLKELGEI